MATLQELLSQKAALDHEIEAAQRTQRANAIAQVRKLMAENGLSVTDIGASPSAVRKGSKGTASEGTRKKVQAKYRHPATGESWTGRGLKPKWLTAELKNGKSISDFTI
jgi:DNA-binding protein H-NS